MSGIWEVYLWRVTGKNIRNNSGNCQTETIEQLEMQVDCLMLELDSVKNDLNDLEQYGRRNSIRLNNYISILPLKDEEQIIKSVVHYLNANVLRGDKPLQLKDIERCHYVRRAKKDKPRAGGSNRCVCRRSHFWVSCADGLDLKPISRFNVNIFSIQSISD